MAWTFPGRTADLYLMPAASLRQAEGAYVDLTGHPKVSPKWTFGYLQSRWGWEDKAYIENTLKTFQDDKLQWTPSFSISNVTRRRPTMP